MLSSIFGFLAIISGFLTVIGMIRPGFVVWWSEKKSRGMAFAVWGSLLVISILGYWITNSQKDDGFKGGETSYAPTRIVRLLA
jgi:hypothetical protein